MTRDQTDTILDAIDDALIDWDGDSDDAAVWTDDGSHEEAWLDQPARAAYEEGVLDPPARAAGGVIYIVEDEYATITRRIMDDVHRATSQARWDALIHGMHQTTPREGWETNGSWYPIGVTTEGASFSVDAVGPGVRAGVTAWAAAVGTPPPTGDHPVGIRGVRALLRREELAGASQELGEMRTDEEWRAWHTAAHTIQRLASTSTCQEHRPRETDNPRERALRARQSRNTGPAAPRLDGRRR